MPLTTPSPLGARLDRGLWDAVADRRTQLKQWTSTFPKAVAEKVELDSITLHDALRGGRGVKSRVLLRSTVDEHGAKLWGVPIEEVIGVLTGDDVLPSLLLGGPLSGTHTKAFTTSCYDAAQSSGAMARMHRFLTEFDPADYNPMGALGAALQLLQAMHEALEFREQTAVWMGVAPYLIAGLTRRYHGKLALAPEGVPPEGIADDYIRYLGDDIVPDRGRAVRFVQQYLVALSTHSTNLSTTGAINYSSGGGSPLGSVAIGVHLLATPKHGGAQGAIQPMLRDLCTTIGHKSGDPLPSKDKLAVWTMDRIKRKLLLDGFGHAVIRGKHDPRGTCLRRLLTTDFPDDEELKLAFHVMDQMPEVASRDDVKAVKGINNPYTNVDYMAAFAQDRYLGLKQPATFVLLFALARCPDYLASWFEVEALGLALAREDNVDGPEIDRRLAAIPTTAPAAVPV